MCVGGGGGGGRKLVNWIWESIHTYGAFLTCVVGIFDYLRTPQVGLLVQQDASTCRRFAEEKNIAK